MATNGEHQFRILDALSLMAVGEESIQQGGASRAGGIPTLSLRGHFSPQNSDEAHNANRIEEY